MWRIGIVFLLSTLAMAQNSSPDKRNSFQIGDPRLDAKTDLSQDFVNPQPLQRLANDSIREQLRQRTRLSLEEQVQQTPRDNVCYAIRSYIFTREDSRAPVLVKTTTCTHVLLGVEKAQQHRVRLVPAN